MSDITTRDQRSRRKEDRREAIIDIAKRSFLEQGFAETSMSTIAARCGGSKTTLWSHFPSKEDLFQAFVDRLVGDFSEALDEALLTGGGTGATLKRFGDVFLAKILSEDARALKRMIACEGHRFPALAKAFYERGPARTRERLARYIADEMATGRLRVGDSEIAARQFLSLCQAGCFSDVIWHRVGGPSSTPGRDVETAVEAFLRIWGKSE
ncbi:TetR/AcrR family transcriptional regulator [Sphingomonas sp. BIUV-7]|uniref:TetR/AcrR family transcriptional regulator n=1 Tax=Sphingomonas natans TaxID=3063330 RepID=A0ABT8Y694_9SPHN|nr:TetR/AcrR family transcriptional regulator [Sphingomonas sp. BIUV-7]MDO6413826.1 TetR/AcrR family transcriptional regulator [Sphingomonas sp. BIUV-7]